MDKFIEKLIGRLEERIEEKYTEAIDKRNVFSDYPYKVQAFKEAIDIVNQLAEEYKDINIITDFLQYVRDNADNYDADNGWDLSDLIDLSIKFCEAEEHNGGWISVEERLPQEDEPVDAVCEVVNIMLKSGTVTSGWCNRYLERWYVLDEHCDYPLQQNYEDVIAWQPLPPAFKPKGE